MAELYEDQIYRNLKRANKNVGFILKNYDFTRDISNDGFVRIFKKVFPETNYSMETIVRARRFVQNTKKIFVKTGARVEWSDAIKKLKEEGFQIQQDIFERV